jgi:hypothetical protein
MSRKNTAPAPAPERKRSSALKKVVYVIIILIVISLILQFLGLGVVDRREDNILIEEPHSD